MNQNLYQNSPTYQSSSYNTKTNRLYQQLLQNNYLSDHIYNPAENGTSPATIKFSIPPSLPRDDLVYNEIDDFDESMLKSVKYNSLLRQFEGTKNSHQITQSLPSNYSIIEIENQSHSTINLYNLSRNFELDMSFSSNNITAKLHNQNSHIYIPVESKHSEMLLQGSANRQQPTVHQISCLESQQKMRKYKSEEYSGQTSKDPINQQQNQDIDSPLPKLLANKYIKNDIGRKFSNSNNGQAQTANFKTILNQIHVIPYKINQEIQPYVFSVPVNQNKGNSYRGKVNSLNLENSRFSFQKEDIKPNKTLYFSNHPHHNQHQNGRPQFYISTHNTPADSQSPKVIRKIPKSQPKPYHLSNQKIARSNSIECKTKPFLNSPKKQMHNQQEPYQRLQLSKVQRVCKHKDQQQQGLKNTQNNSQSIIYDETEVNICCGITRLQNAQKQTNANRIIFRPKQQTKGFTFCDQVQPSIEITNLSKPKRANCNNTKINPVKMIKSFNQNRESESQKKGIKLVGFNCSFSKKE